MDCVKEVRKRGGVALSALLVRSGVKAHAIEKAVAAGSLIRARRRWVALPDADTMLVWAASAGVVLSCVTGARRHGLWVLDQGCGTHVAAPPHSGRIGKWRQTTVHRAAPLVPRAPGLLIDPVENVLALVAACQPYEAALAVWESALNKKIVDPLVLGRLRLSARARELLAAANPFADSGLESFVLPRLAWMKVRIVPQVWLYGHRVDFLIGDRLVLQIDGGTHVDAQRAADIRHDAELMLRGYHIIRVGYDQVVYDWPGVQALIMQAVAQGLHRTA